MKFKKVIAVILMVAVLCTYVSALEFTSDTGYNDESNTVVAVYTGYEYSQATMMCYDVTRINGATAQTSFEDMEATPIIGIMQQTSDGSFRFSIDKDFSGRVVLMVGGQVETPIRMLLNINDGELITIENVITAETDAKGAERVLVNSDENVEIQNGAKLMNAVIDTRENYVKIGDAILRGKIVFDNEGVVDAKDGSTVSMTSSAKAQDGTTNYNYGFVQKTELTGEAVHSITVTASNGTETRQKTYDFTVPSGVSGNARFKVVITKVPEGTILTAK